MEWKMMRMECSGGSFEIRVKDVKIVQSEPVAINSQKVSFDCGGTIEMQITPMGQKELRLAALGLGHRKHQRN